MYCAKAILVFLITGGVLTAAEISGASALNYTREVVAHGPRVPGSAALAELRKYIHSKLAEFECEVSEDSFTAETPEGPIRMHNIIARFPGKTGKAVFFSGHYDTKLLPGNHFVGANDAGSSTGLLLEMARVLSGQERKHDVYLVWFDGEESFGDWSDTDGIYGSRHLAKKWHESGMLSKIVALINIDMIGDKDLGVLEEYYSARSLTRLVRQVAEDLGYEKYFFVSKGAIEDDHVPFLRLGVNAIDLIDFEFGPRNSYWHTPEDTMDKLSADSLEIVGRVCLEILRRLEQ